MTPVTRLLLVAGMLALGACATAPYNPATYKASVDPFPGGGSPTGAPPPAQSAPRPVIASVGSDGAYVVQPGDTVYKLSRRHGVTVRALIETNHLTAPYGLLIGQRLIIPRQRGHVVVAGETVQTIAAANGVAVSALTRANNLQPPYQVRPGQQLTLPDSVVAPGGPAPSPSGSASIAAPPPSNGSVEALPAPPVAAAPVTPSPGPTPGATTDAPSAGAITAIPSAPVAAPVTPPAVQSASPAAGAATAITPITPTPITPIAPVKPSAPTPAATPTPTPTQPAAATPPAALAPAASTDAASAGTAASGTAASGTVASGTVAAGAAAVVATTTPTGDQSSPATAAPSVPATPPVAPDPAPTAEASPPPAPTPPPPADNGAPPPPPPPRGAKTFLWPVRGRVVATYGEQDLGLHNDGINIAAPRGTPVRAAENGVVVYAGNEIKGFGNLLLVRHADGFMTAYAHNETLAVHKGDVVRRGQTIARVGSSGNVTEPQLHFEIRRGTQAIDPEPQLDSPNS